MSGKSQFILHFKDSWHSQPGYVMLIGHEAWRQAIFCYFEGGVVRPNIDGFLAVGEALLSRLVDQFRLDSPIAVRNLLGVDDDEFSDDIKVHFALMSLPLMHVPIRLVSLNRLTVSAPYLRVQCEVCYCFHFR